MCIEYILAKGASPLDDNEPTVVVMLANMKNILDSKVHGANMGPKWVLSASDGPHVGPMNFAVWEYISLGVYHNSFESVKPV